jgi:hypothetical protein
MDSITLRPSKKKWTLMLLGSIAFVIGGTFIINHGGPGSAVIGWTSICFFGLGIPISLLWLVPGWNTLVLTPDGLSVKIFGRVRNAWIIKWSDISNFSVMEFHRPTTIFYRRPLKMASLSYASPIRDKMPFRQVRRMDSLRLKYGCDGVLPDTYGMKVESLVELLNEWRTKYS